MRKNLPVTKTEKPLKDNSILISKTDLKGIITYASHDFSELSGFSDGELIGKSHNIIRHPDMPAPVFKNMWDTIQKDRPWTGVVKNRCKNGDFYVVYAEVSGIKENGKLSGFMSVRYKPTDTQRKDAFELYEKINGGKIIFKGEKRKKSLSMKARFLILQGLTAFLFLFLAGTFWFTSKLASNRIDEFIQNVKAANKVELVFKDQVKSWKDLLLHRQDPDFLKKSFEDLKKLNSEIQKNMENLISSDLLKDLIDKNGSIRQALKEILDSHLKNVEGTLDKVKNIGDLSPKEIKKLDLFVQKADREMAKNLDSVMKRMTESAAKVRSERLGQIEFFTLVIFFIALIIAMTLIYFILRSFRRPMQRAVQIADEMASGDLTSRVNVESNDEMGMFQEAMKKMLINIRGFMTQILESANETVKTAKSLSEHAEKLSETAQDQAAATEETSASVEELSSSAENIGNIIKRQASNVQANKENSTSMMESMRHVNQVINTLRELARDSAGKGASGEGTIKLASQAMEEIKHSAQQISDIIGMITDISDQTNLLSLNAAIEAARAGEEGKGFAVVADEISKLAERTASSVKEVDKLITYTGEAVNNGSSQFSEASKILSEVIDAVRDIDNSASGSVETVDELLQKTKNISSNVDKVSSLAQEIVIGSQEQQNATSEISKTVEMIANQSQIVGESAVELNTLASTTEHQAGYLKNLVKNFKIKKG